MRALLLGLVFAGTLAVGSASAYRIPCNSLPEARAWREREPIRIVTSTPDPELGEHQDIVAEHVVCVSNCCPDRTRENHLRLTGFDPAERIGFKAGLTTSAAQKRFGADGPILGLLFPSMILSDGAEVHTSFGARPVWEADLLLVVGDAAINRARSRDDVTKAIRGYRPFIELPDLIYSPDTNINATMLAYINVGARLGVAGEERPLPRDALTSLAAMRVRAFDGSGALLAEGKGSDALGHPLDVVLWVRDAVHREGGRLKAGDIISVGAFTPLTPPKAGQTIRVRYEGLPGDPEVSVRFR